MLPQGVCRKEKGFHTGEKGEKIVHTQLSTFPQNVVESDKLYGLEKWKSIWIKIRKAIRIVR